MTKIRAFGLVEAMIASFIAITVLSGAVALASSINKSVTTDGSFSEAEKIADNFLENLSFANSQGRVFFNTRTSPRDRIDGELFSIDCFDSRYTEVCKTAFTGATPSFIDFYWNNLRTINDNASDPGYYKITQKELNNDTFSDGFFKIKTTVSHFKDPITNLDTCRSVSGVTISPEKCRVVDVEVKWSENVGDQTYKVSKYITDWTR